MGHVVVVVLVVRCAGVVNAGMLLYSTQANRQMNRVFVVVWDPFGELVALTVPTIAGW